MNTLANKLCLIAGEEHLKNSYQAMVALDCKRSSCMPTLVLDVHTLGNVDMAYLESLT